MKKIILTLALIIGLAAPAFAQTILPGGYLEMPKNKTQLVSIKHYKATSPYMPNTTEVRINFIGVGLYNADWDNWVNNIFLANLDPNYRGVPRVSAGDPSVVFFYKGLNAGSIKSLTGGNDRLMFTVPYKDGSDDAELNVILAEVAVQYGNPALYTKTESNYTFYTLTTYVKK